MRFETPGRQGQVDFGTFTLPWGWRHALVEVLAHSRLLWLRLYPRQTMAVLTEGLESAFARFGGVPAELLFDQMRAVVLSDDRTGGGELVLNAEFLRFATHWGFVPAVPRADQGQGGAADPLPARRSRCATTAAWSPPCSSSRLPAVKTLAQFDFAFQPSIRREQIESLHELGFLDRAENVILLGPGSQDPPRDQPRHRRRAVRPAGVQRHARRQGHRRCAHRPACYTPLPHRQHPRQQLPRARTRRSAAVRGGTTPPREPGVTVAPPVRTPSTPSRRRARKCAVSSCQKRAFWAAAEEGRSRPPARYSGPGRGRGTAQSVRGRSRVSRPVLKLDRNRTPCIDFRVPQRGPRWHGCPSESKRLYTYTLLWSLQEVSRV